MTTAGDILFPAQPSATLRKFATRSPAEIADFLHEPGLEAIRKQRNQAPCTP